MVKDLVKELRDFRDSNNNLSEQEKEAYTRVANALCHWPPSEHNDIIIFTEDALGLEQSEDY